MASHGGPACSDLRNLLPAQRRVNQQLKCDRLPSAATLQRARHGMMGWWNRAYLGNAVFVRRFGDEVRAALTPSSDMPDTDEVYAAVALQRLRLHQDQQVPEWSGIVSLGD